MSPKDEFLYKLIVQIEYAEKAAKANDGDSVLSDFALSLRAVHGSLSRFPTHHPIFLSLADCKWRPQSLASSFKQVAPTSTEQFSLEAA